MSAIRSTCETPTRCRGRSANPTAHPLRQCIRARLSCLAVCLLTFTVVLATPQRALSDDLYAPGDQTPSYSATPRPSGTTAGACQQAPVASPIALFDVIERALCESPKTRAAWAAINGAAANVALSRSAYLPTLGADVKGVYQHNETQATNAPQLQTNYTKLVNEETLSLGWVLYDFGARSASAKNSKALLLAAQANRDSTLQSVFASTAKDYFTAQAANANVLSKRRIESAAREILEAATARVNKGAAPITDQLQAKTALAQAIYERAKSEGDSRSAIGALAVDMSLSPEEALSLPELDAGALPDTSFVRAVHDLLEDARETHPKILAAAAQLQAALANVRFERAQGRPSVQLVGEIDRSNQPVSASLGQPELPARTRENYIGIKIAIPIFDGFRRDSQVRQAEAQADVEEQGLRDAQQQVAVSIWSSVQTLQTDTENLRNTDVILQSAQQTFEATQHRYQSGVGNILELLNAQSTVAASEQQSIQAQLEWRTARLQLAASLGRLGMWAIER
jgi:outer membrane protein